MFKTRCTLALFGAATVTAVLTAFAGCTQSGTTPPPLVGTINPPPAPGSAALVVTSNFGGFAVFLPTDSGTTAPQAAVSGSNTGINEPKSVARDANGNYYVGNSISNCNGQIIIFDRTANGNAFPAATISGSSTTLDDSINGIAVDASKNIFVTQDNSLTDGCSWGGHAAQIMEFSGVGASGNVAPTSTFTGGLVEPNQITFDSGGLLWVADTDAGRVRAYNVSALAPGSNVLLPVKNIGSASFCTFGSPNPVGIEGVAVDASGNVYVSQTSCFIISGRIFKFKAADVSACSGTCTLTPTATIAPPSPAPVTYRHIATDGTKLYVAAEESRPNISVFNIPANGAGTVSPAPTLIYDSSGTIISGSGVSL